jgi:tRNA pseudouridine38-40 synthase
MRCIKLIIEYDGTDFVGWQSQLNGRAVQDELVKALQQLTGTSVTLNGAGRTDSGVHARGQVAGFRTESVLPLPRMLSGLNGLLPQDVRVLAAEEMPVEFHPRFDARQRRYSYKISPDPTAIDRRKTWYLKCALDITLMNNAAELVIGSHDFTSFCKHITEVEDPVCNVSESRWSVTGRQVVYCIAADRFVHGMVRTLVGTIVDVGRGHIPPEWFPEILAARDRREAGPAAPAKGLCLEEVLY